MRICLYWNAGAGEGQTLPEITTLIEDSGHHVDTVIEHGGDELAQACRAPLDCVVAAGGDGTVARAGRVLAGGDMPLAILPLGTANNIAGSLGVSADPREAIAAWRDSKVVRIDVGIVEDACGYCYFLESVGVGLVPAGIERGRQVLSKDDAGDSAAQVARARAIFLDTLMTLEPRPYGLKIEGASFEDQSLLVEVLNIASVGPRIRLSPEANPADGLLSVVVAGAADREAIAAHLRGRWDDHSSHARLKSWRATHVEVTGWHTYHVDDEVRVATGETVSIGIKPGFLAVLA